MESASVDELYGLPPDQFIPSRDALVKALKKDGDKEAAAAVKALRKPSIAAWAVNQVMRTQRADARELADAGEQLRAAKGGQELRAAMARERSAVEALVRAARGLLLEDGSALSQTTLDRVRTTLHAAASDAAVREEVLAGRVAKEREAVGIAGLGGGGEDEDGGSGFGDLLAASLPAKKPKRSAAAPKQQPARRTKADDEAAKRASEARREAERKHQAKRKELMAAIREAKAEAGKLGLAESTAERAADAAQAAAEEAQARLARALKELKEKSAAAEAARKRLDKAEKALEAFEEA